MFSVLAGEQREESPSRVHADDNRIVQDERGPHPLELARPLTVPPVTLHDPAVPAKADDPSLEEVRDQKGPIRRVDNQGVRVPQIGLVCFLEEDVPHGNDHGPRGISALAGFRGAVDAAAQERQRPGDNGCVSVGRMVHHLKI